MDVIVYHHPKTMMVLTLKGPDNNDENWMLAQEWCSIWELNEMFGEFSDSTSNTFGKPFIQRICH